MECARREDNFLFVSDKLIMNVMPRKIKKFPSVLAESIKKKSGLRAIIFGPVSTKAVSYSLLLNFIFFCLCAQIYMWVDSADSLLEIILCFTLLLIWMLWIFPLIPSIYLVLLALCLTKHTNSAALLIFLHAYQAFFILFASFAICDMSLMF